MPIHLTRDLQHGRIATTITVRSAAGWDRYQEAVLFRHVWRMVTGRDYSAEDIGGIESRALNDFVELVNRTVSISGLPIVWPTPQSGEKDLCAGFEYIKEIPLVIYNGWLQMLVDVEAAPGDPELFPPEHLSTEQKKAEK